MTKTYILVSVDNIDSTFTMKGEDGETLSCEIYIVNPSPESITKDDKVVPALTQADAFRQFKKIYYPTLFKKSTKGYCEKELFF